ncbi:hypothetical protein PTNB85_09929 [Pyrenophora teres f. teres]|nr:hypothetical protein PTNB85_09929 [Pyrenophora teres f. teres]KAE8846629.1 hypothetical protein HRS9139_01196 [Pyrenophora teres f. teres]KAE8853060.1 hypothetical protein HRS9122_00052 [Pyrenophora teres f. teres]
MKFTTGTILAILVAIACTSPITPNSGIDKRLADGDTGTSETETNPGTTSSPGTTTTTPTTPPSGHDQGSDGACYGSCPGRGQPHTGRGCHATFTCRGGPPH